MTTEPTPEATIKAAFKDPKPTAERIIQLAGRVLSGDILLPKFQRDFVWSRKQTLDLLDSIARNYPIGSMLLWQSRQQLSNERKIADLEVARTRTDYPVNYLLDGQQRLSTICGALYWSPGEADSPWNIAYDLKSERFMHLDSLDEPAMHLVPLRYLSDPAKYFSRLTGLAIDLREKADSLFNRFTDYQVAIVTLGDMEIKDVAPVFERINSTGTPLTIVDLMRAATWSPTFDIMDEIDQVRAELAPKRYEKVDRKVLLRSIAAAAGLGLEVSGIDDLRNLTEAELRAAVDSVKDSSKRAADYLATEIGAPSAASLPYANQFVVLSELFRKIPKPRSEQLRAISNWFWLTTVSSYFGGWNSGQMIADRDAIASFAAGESQTVSNTNSIPSAVIWRSRDFRSNSATSKMAALMLGHARPVDLLNGQIIDMHKSLAWNNDKEFHHFFPKAFLKTQGYTAAKANTIGNIVMLTSASNITIRDQAPSAYLAAVRDQIGEDELKRRLDLSLVNEAAYAAALADDYEAFLEARAQVLEARAISLVGVAVEVMADDISSKPDDADDDVSE